MSLGTGAGDGGSGGTNGGTGGGTGAAATGGGTGSAGTAASGGTGSTAGSAPAAGSGGTGAGSGGTGAGSGGTGAGSGAAGGQGGMGTGAAGTQTSWRDTLPDDLKSDATLNKYSDIPNLAKAHIELQKLIGQKGIIKPGKEASPEQIKAFREALGIPSDPSKYDMGEFDKSITVPPETLEWARKMGAEHGIEPAALKAVMSDYMKQEALLESAQEKAVQAEIAEGFKGLRSEWGEAFNQNLTRANFAAQKLGGQGLIDRLKEFGADNDPVIIKAFAEAAKLYGEDRLREAGAGDGRQTPQELDGEIAQVRSQLIGLTAIDGRRPALLARLESLSKQKTGGK